jgi:hypothetical protein
MTKIPNQAIEFEMWSDKAIRMAMEACGLDDETIEEMFADRENRIFIDRKPHE